MAKLILSYSPTKFYQSSLFSGREICTTESISCNSADANAPRSRKKDRLQKRAHRISALRGLWMPCWKSRTGKLLIQHILPRLKWRVESTPPKEIDRCRVIMNK